MPEIYNQKDFELTPYEKLVLDTVLLGDFNVISSTFFELDSSVSSDLNECFIRKGLALLQKRHPFLRATTYVDKIDKTRAYLKILNEPESKLNDKIELDWLNFDDSKNIIESMEIFNSQPFNINDDSLLWRCQLIGYNDEKDHDLKKYVLNLSIALHICDGICISTLSLELINLLNSLLTGSECNEMKTVLKPAPNLHQVVTEKGLFKQTQQEAVSKKTNGVEFLLDEKFRSYGENGLKINLIKLDKILTKNLLNNCKKNNSRMTACINTAIFYALRKLYLMNNLEIPSEFSCELPANIRLRCQPNVEFNDLRLQIFLAHLETSKSKFGKYSDFWSDVKYIQGLVEESTSFETGAIFCLSHNLDYLRAFDSEFNQAKNKQDACLRLNKKNKCDLLLSNIGTHVFNRIRVVDGPIKITQTYFGDSLVSDPNILPALMFHCSFWNDEIMIQLSSNKSAIGSIYVEQLVENFIDTLKQNSD